MTKHIEPLLMTRLHQLRMSYPAASTTQRPQHPLKSLPATRPAGELVTYPNSKLREMPIINASKSANRMDHTAFLLDVGTPLEVLKRVEQAGTDHLRAHQPDFDDTEVMMIMHGVMDPYKVKVSFWWTYSFTADDIVRFCLVRSAVVNALQMELKVVGVQHTNMYLDRGNAQQRAAAQRLV